MKQAVRVLLSVFVAFSCLLLGTEGHGRMMSPVGRSSRWRYDSSAPTNYDDTGLYCGGFWKQTENGGLCGLCGDDWSLEQPRPNELGGKYGGGVIVESYIATTTAEIVVEVTANHLGNFQFHLCDLDEFGSESDDCFNKYPLKFSDGSLKQDINTTMGTIKSTVDLPSGVQCEHCVMRWTYTAGNNWGVCEDGTGAMGCGAQETFVNCADISILSSVKSLLYKPIQTVGVPVEEVAVEVPIEVTGTETS
ncbi:uncharacterized protein [Drosophila tropicalis]|uniref:uncharacterized protein n=1 Tax=Drosophila tropicalis TaxID=46794 RepID=UPI0035AB689D